MSKSANNISKIVSDKEIKRFYIDSRRPTVVLAEQLEGEQLEKLKLDVKSKLQQEINDNKEIEFYIKNVDQRQLQLF